MTACASCGAELQEGARFCAFCGTAVAAPGEGSEERRTVSILFVDLVGFTERSDRADPEDVRRTLVPFHGRVKEELERFGGTLDKFIGDAVMGVFGAPVAHGDDPVRAVRAALRILASLDELRAIDPHIALRIAVNTGEAVVSYGRGPQVGEAVAGDVVNTASRMQSLAPPDTVVIGPLTLEAVRDRFEVEALPPALVKGKAEALTVWRVVGERTQAEADRVPFVGRADEVAELARRFDQVVESSSSHLVTVLGDAGVGKSRLVGRFAASLGDRARRLSTTCQRFGVGVTFAPVNETVRQLATIDPAADPSTTMSMLEQHVASLGVEGEDRRWLLRTLGAVMTTGATGAEVAPEEIAQAWARLLEAATSDAPLLVEIQDVHDAMPAFREVLASVVELLARRPVLFVVTSRPTDEPSLAPERSSTVALGPLGEEDTRTLLGSVLLDASVRDDERAAVLERAGGNPLFAIEFARMLAEGGGGAAPISVQAVIAARLDAVPAEERALALDASVLGEEVWPEALAAIVAGDGAEVKRGIDDLVRRGLLEPRPSSFPGLEAFGFSHALIREVAYGRLPRAARARRHLAAARWLEFASADRREEWAESLARHYAAAAELASASNETHVTAAALEPALRWLLAAGDRAARVDPTAAFETFERALALVPPDAPEREVLLGRSASAGRRSGLLSGDEVLARHEASLELARRRGDPSSIGEALVRVGNQLAIVGEADRARAMLEEAVATLEALPPGPALARAYAFSAEEELFAGNTAATIALADRALPLVEDELHEVAIMCLHLRGDARCSMGDLDGGLADLVEALRRAEASGRANDIVGSHNYLAEWRWASEGAAAGFAEWEKALELAERRNIRSQAMYSKAAALWVLFEMGKWDRVLAWSQELLSLPPGRIDPAVEANATIVRTHVLLRQGRRSEAVDPDALVELADRTHELGSQAPALIAAATIAHADGDDERASRWLERFESLTDGVASEYRTAELVRAVELAAALDRPEIAERLIASTRPTVDRDRRRVEAASAILAETLEGR
jgi:class 3 adenylate cyclase/tetratricopeptide (TPR) repeat protein